jgi:tetratricopeptide (TPR) repeat protein
MPFPLEPFSPPPPVSLTSEPFAPAVPSLEEAAPVEEAAWLDDAASASEEAPAPVHEPLSPPIFAPEPPPDTRTAAEVTTADELWAEEPVPAAWAEIPEPVEPPLEATVEPSTIDLEALPLPDVDVEEEPHPIFVPEPSLGLQPPTLEPEPVVRVLPEVLPEEQPEPVWEPEPAAPPPAAYAGGEATNATVTLGDLYFRQGHYAEAERHFREVLDRHPDNAAAREGLERIAALGPQPETPALDARRLLAGYRPNPVQPADAEVRSRKVFLLNRYLDRLRQGSHHDVP